MKRKLNISKGNKHQIARMAAAPMSGVTVDRDAGLIRNVAIMTVGPARGWGFWCDMTTLKQVLALLKTRQVGMRSRFRHPAEPDGTPVDDMGTLVGHVINPHIDGETLRGDVQLGTFAQTMPGLGNVRDYLLGVAEEAPHDVGLSAVIHYEPVSPEESDPRNPGLPVARVQKVDAIDWVSEPAANPRGLLSAKEPTAGSGDQQTVMSPELYQALVREFSMSPTATMQEAEAFFDSLDVYDQQEALNEVLSATDKEAQMNATLKRLKPHQKEVHQALKKKMLQTAAEHGVKLSDGDADNLARKMALTKKADPPEAPAAEEPASEPTEPTEPTEPEEPTEPAEPAEPTEPEDSEDPHDPEDPDDDDDASAELSARRDARLIKREQTRVASLSALGKVLSVPAATVAESIRKGHTVREARKIYLSAVGQANAPITNVEVSPDSRFAALRQAIPEAIVMRAGKPVDKPHPLAAKMQHMTLLGFCKAYLSSAGITGLDYLPDSQIVDLAVSNRALSRKVGSLKVAMLAESVGDFPGLLLDAINKSFQGIYRVAPPTWQKWAQKGKAKDFKNINRPLMTDIPEMQERQPGKPINYVAIGDSNEVYVLREFAEGIMLTRRAIINDDMNVFGDIPQALTQNCIRLEEKLAYQQLAMGAAGQLTMSDGKPLFIGTHDNLVATGSGGAPSPTQLNNMWKLIRTQTGPNGTILDLVPKILIVPVALEESTVNAVQSNTLISLVATGGAPAVQGDKNVWAGRFKEVIATPYLDGYSETAWYMCCSPNDGQIKTLEMCFLEGEESPVVKQESDFDTDDMKIAVRHTVAAKFLNWRGVAANAGD
ncbi:MAG: hypothetical protein M0Z50_04750 [Planctomycetia bacterium]|nr:hypothetical protein [Planctomycetia bacterium]